MRPAVVDDLRNAFNSFLSCAFSAVRDTSSAAPNAETGAAADYRGGCDVVHRARCNDGVARMKNDMCDETVERAMMN